MTIFSGSSEQIVSPNTFDMTDQIDSAIIGDVNGRFSEVFGKLSTLHAKQSFGFAIIAGNLFADPDTRTSTEERELGKLLDGEIEVPVTTYFSLGTRSVPEPALKKLESNDGELCPNLIAFGRRVSIKTSDGFRIVAVGGSYNEEASDDSIDQYESTYTSKVTDSLANESGEVDFLITSDWPASITDGSRVEQQSEAPRGVQCIATLCAKLKPRYHFSSSESFYEREPFFHAGEAPRHITRFISLAPFGNDNGQKWIKAFSLEPGAPPPQTLPPGCTAPPFTCAKKRPAESREDTYTNYRYSNSNGTHHHDHGRRHKHPRRHQPPRPEKCYFCLSADSFETHMVTSIGNDSYMTIAKGPLTTKTTFPSLPFPAHMLLIPLEHVPTLAAIPSEHRNNSIDELHRYRNALNKMVTAKSRSPEDNRAKLGTVTWEISRAGGFHLHWQFLPISIDLIQRGLVEGAFDVEAENLAYPAFVKGEQEIAEAEAGDYFKVMIWSETVKKDMVLPIDSTFRFDLQFGRRVMAKLLGLESRMDWKACAQEKGEEEADAEAFKAAFKEYDFSIDDE